MKERHELDEFSDEHEDDSEEDGGRSFFMGRVRLVRVLTGTGEVKQGGLMKTGLGSGSDRFSAMLSCFHFPAR